jgi:hypothetical protein
VLGRRRRHRIGRLARDVVPNDGTDPRYL